MVIKVLLGWSIMFVVISISTMPIYGKESSLQRKGNIKGMEEQIINLKEDYFYLENEILRLMEECK